MTIIAWARKAGLGAIGLPRYAGIEPNQPFLTPVTIANVNMPVLDVSAQTSG